MLNRTKVMSAVQRLAGKLFPDMAQVSHLAQNQWQKIICDPTFVHRVCAAKSSFLVPSWQGNLADVYPVTQGMSNYLVVALDGSQIYPDRHLSSAGCFLLNVGGALLSYGEQSRANFFSDPQVYVPSDLVPEDGTLSFSVDLIDLKREELELMVACREAEELLTSEPDAVAKTVFFIDGTLIFWQLEEKLPEVKARFLASYLASLEYFYRAGLLIAGYISFPKSKELVNLIKLSLCRFDVADCIPCHSTYTTFPCKAVDALIDTAILRSFLPPFHRTTVFASNSKIVQSYPLHLRPHFVYLDVGKEIVRLEFPAWIADDARAVDRLCRVALDQSLKGQGYPVCLAEAHEQAVVKGNDRDFFFHVICRVGLEQNKAIILSRKSIKKRGMGV